MIRKLLATILIPFVVAASLLRADAQVMPSAMYPILVPATAVVPHVDNQWVQVEWSPDLNLFAAISNRNASTAPVMTSSNGTAWALHTAPQGAGNGWTGIVWGHSAGLFCVIGDARSMWSTDGINWTLVTGLPSPHGWWSVTWADALGLFVASGLNGDVITSTDCATWTDHATPTARQYRTITWSPSLALFAMGAFVSAGTTAITTSSDGVTWTDQTTPATTDTVTGIVWAAGLAKFVAVSAGGSSTTNSLTSVDGITWILTDTSGALTAITNKSNTLVWSQGLTLLTYSIENDATGAVDIIRSSATGLSFTDHSLPVSSSWQGGAWSPSLALFVYVNNNLGDLSAVITSTDGASWTLQTTP